MDREEVIDGLGGCGRFRRVRDQHEHGHEQQNCDDAKEDESRHEQSLRALKRNGLEARAHHSTTWCKAAPVYDTPGLSRVTQTMAVSASVPLAFAGQGGGGPPSASEARPN